MSHTPQDRIAQPETSLDDALQDGPPPSATLFQLTTGTWISQAVGVAAGLGVADALAAGPRPVERIAEVVGAHSPTLYRLLRALADIEVFRELDGRRFALTPVSELLRSDVRGSMRGWAIMTSSPFHRDAWTALQESVRTGEPAFDRVHGRQGFDYFADHPEAGEILNSAMTAVSGLSVAIVAGSYDFTPFGKIVDVGGNHGRLLAAVLPTAPAAHGVLYDLPHVVADAGRILEEAGVADRCERQGGDFFDSVPPGADAYLLSNVIHDWDDDRSVRILANCRKAMNPSGRVLLSESVLPDDAVLPHPAKWMDLEMIVMGSGRQRTESEYRRLFEQADLRLTRIIPTDSVYDLVEAVPA